MKRKLYLMVALLVALAVAGGSFAYTATSGSISAEVTTGSSSFADITTTKPSGFPETDKYGVAPNWTPVVNTAGGITPGRLYYIDPKNYTGDLLVMLYLTNVGDLAKGYSYLNMGVNFYKADTGWTEETSRTGTAPDLTYYLTLSNGYVTFILPAAGGWTKGVITIDNGAYYCISGTPAYLMPRFYIDVRQA
jgi:hypothetical protein